MTLGYKHIVKQVGWIIMMLASVVFCINVIVFFRTSTFIYSNTEDVAPAQAIIVLGARVYPNGQLSPMLLDRVKTTIDLYEHGKGNVILVSGDHGRVAYDEVNTIKDYLLKNGVPAEDIFLDHAGFDTYDSLYRAHNIFKIDSGIVVTQRFHLPRSVYVGRTLGMNLSGVSADRQQYAGIVYNYVREIPATVKAFARVFIHSKPVYLGAPIPITGNSKDSWDDQQGVNDAKKMLQGAKRDILVTTTYDPSYYDGGYPPEGSGVCADVIDRALRYAGYDVKTLIDADIVQHPADYGLDEMTVDPNIDFRRVANLLVFFKKFASSHTTELSWFNRSNHAEWRGGDIVVFGRSLLLPGMHIAVVSDKRNWFGVPYLIHNYKNGTVEDNSFLFWPAPIVGHFRL